MPALGYRVAPAFRQLDRGRGRARSVQIQPSMRTGPDTGIIAIAPIDQVMTALCARARMIGNFIGGESQRLPSIPGWFQ